MLHAIHAACQGGITLFDSVLVYIKSVCHTTCLKVRTLVLYKLHVHCSFTPVDIFHCIQLYTYQPPYLVPEVALDKDVPIKFWKSS